MTVEQKRVLVVDDDPEVRALLVWVLRRHALQVDQASDGREALALINQHQYAVIVLDLIMPVLDGFAVLNALAGISTGVAPVVLVVTGADRGDIGNLDPQRVHGIVKKPFDPEELASIVVACTEIRSRNAFGTMAIATVLAGSPLLALLNRFSA
ncbi:MAG: two-component system, OmpR family, response regulator [Thermoanaerobaculia bacterium]|jgi:CheY-like chemotaxis protein|nr:two-component system, OmpR family, response regulator [Thermoanaerobaculia bacterium]